MSLQTTPQGDRIQIAIYGKRNAGKSSLINAITGQQTAIVSEIKGTTTDPVSKAMELLPLGPCMFIDTPGLDDEGALGKERVKKAMQVLHKADIVLLVMDACAISREDLEQPRGIPKEESRLAALLEEKRIPYILVLNQADRLADTAAQELCGTIASKNNGIPVRVVSAARKSGMEELKDTLASCLPDADAKLHIVGDLIEEGDTVVLVVPVDSAAPKGRLILPQQQVIRDILDNHAMAVVTQVPQLKKTLENLSGRVRLVVTDSQAFKEVACLVPPELPLTSFSILFARHKGSLEALAKGVRTVDSLKDGDRVLIAEGCTHRRQCGDIGTVKIPNWLRSYTGKKLLLDTCSGMDFPSDLSPYRLVIHCGGCTLHEKEMKHRILSAAEQEIPIVNYGIFIAYVNGILKRSVEVFPDIYALFQK